jgi:hypothetical protein
MKTNSKVRARIGLAAAACAGLVLCVAAPASATGSTIGCAGSTESILNGNQSGGNSISITTNYSLACGGVSNRARTNVYGQILWSSYQTPVSGQNYYSRTYFGSMYMSRHYHNGTSNDLYY